MGVENNFTFHLKNVSVNGQRRGCSGFIVENSTGKIVWVDTEPFFTGGLFGNSNQTLLYRFAKHIKDYSGLGNHWGRCENIADHISSLLAH